MRWALLLLPALFACGPRTPAAPPLTPEQQECRNEARRSPEVVEARRRWSPGVNDRIILPQIQEVEDGVFRACLRDRRLPGPSGVQGTR
jgi:hypothetical protein